MQYCHPLLASTRPVIPSRPSQLHRFNYSNVCTAFFYYWYVRLAGWPAMSSTSHRRRDVGLPEAASGPPVLPPPERSVSLSTCTGEGAGARVCGAGSCDTAWWWNTQHIALRLHMSVRFEAHGRPATTPA